jgi:UDP-N-acetylmuramoyl-L-alanyl-D-glutamate--2,6-diaminopimelate ligase
MAEKMTLKALGSIVGIEYDVGGDRSFSHITEDSRKVVPGSLFVAVTGENVDGHDYIPQAREQGAVAVLGNRPDQVYVEGLPYLYAEYPRRVLGKTAHALAGDPTQDMTVIGVTGTNGKSSTVCLVQSILEAWGKKAAAFGTLGYWVGGKKTEAPHTTPFAEDLAGMFGCARDKGVTHAVMEVSSHALEQERVAGIQFAAAVFTNLTQDHLDYHGTMEEYAAQKIKLFQQINESGVTIANADDPFAKLFRDASRATHLTFGNKGDCRVVKAKHGTHSTHLLLVTPWGPAEITTQLLGAHNIANILGAVTVCGGLGVPVDSIVRGVESLRAIPGRFEDVDAGQEFRVIVDYAHTEDGLRNVLRAAREICTGSIITVFGCGGDRDQTKRSKMGAAALEGSDYCIVTSDNPRSESPERILMDIEQGIQHHGGKRGEDYEIIDDRADAIHAGLARAKQGDLVLVAGKGHEDYQILNSGRIHFDDREAARTWLEAR